MRKTAIFFLILILFSMIPIPFVKADWLAGWDQRVKITVDSGDIDGALTNFPFLIYISDSSGINNEDITFIFDEVGANSLKIAVTEDDGTTECKVEIERWDLGNEEAWLWVKGPSIVSGSDTDFYLYFDNDHADNGANVGEIGSPVGQSVWDSEYSAVWHMRDKTTSTIWDSTSYENTATKTVATEPDEVNAKIDKGQYFDGDDITTVSDEPELDIMANEYWSVEFWVNKDGATSGQIILSKSVDTGYERWHIWLVGSTPTSNNIIYMTIYDTNSVVDNIASTGILADSTWYHILFSGRNENEVICYLNGEYKSETAIATISSWSNPDELRIGVRFHASASNFYEGLFDEIRLSSGSSVSARRSAEWAKASYETQIDDLLDWGIEEFSILPPSNPNLLFGAGFNASSPYVKLHWNHSLLDVQLFEVQNLSDKISWDYLGNSTTANYTDTEVFNGTARFYRVRACNFTDGSWFNSSFSDIDFEIVYFLPPIGVIENGITIIESDAPWIALAIILSIIAFLLAMGKRK